LGKTRLDKYLWSIRIFKTRTLASNACRNGHVKSATGKNLKPSYLIAPAETLRVKKNGFNLILRSKKIIGKRVGAPIAQECYENLTSDEELNKYKDWFIGKARPEIREKGSGRPTKRDRRELDEFKIWMIEEE